MLTYSLNRHFFAANVYFIKFMLFLYKGNLFHRFLNDKATKKWVNSKIFLAPTQSHKRMLTDFLF